VRKTHKREATWNWKLLSMASESENTKSTKMGIAREICGDELESYAVKMVLKNSNADQIWRGFESVRLARVRKRKARASKS
jgi:hypothetical protein